MYQRWINTVNGKSLSISGPSSIPKNACVVGMSYQAWYSTMDILVKEKSFIPNYANWYTLSAHGLIKIIVQQAMYTYGIVWASIAWSKLHNDNFKINAFVIHKALNLLYISLGIIQVYFKQSSDRLAIYL